ncbi:MAG: flagellar hook-basal body complex protein, partial [Pyrinomonadaceae bacterium]|nr:flagellar hook-basal body complex protein [Pyrinomonadaceae bacterium]
MAFSFNTSLAGLNANSNALSVIGNNIANANTIGFRSGKITFMDVFSNAAGVRLNGSGNTRQIGNGVQTAAVHTNFSQGNINEATSPLHVAIQGDGFFPVQNTDGTAAYTRAGDFSVNKDGFLVNPSGAQVQGYLADRGQIPDSAVLTSLQIPIGETLPPQATTEGTLRMNLDVDSLTGATFVSTMQVYDTRGTARKLDMTFERQADGTFHMTSELDGNPALNAVNGNPADATPVVFDFDANGDLVGPTSLVIEPDQAFIP